MNKVFDYNGTFVSASKPVKQLRTVRKVLNIDSGDRDLTKYPRNNDIVIYLPRVYENVVSLRLMSAEIPSEPTTISSTRVVGAAATGLYYIIDIEGLNKGDECSEGADRSGYPDGFFAKIPADFDLVTYYNDHSSPENVARYTPAIGKLDRLHIRMRTHTQKKTDSTVFFGSQYSLMFEIEYIDNVFDDFSSLETRISERGV
jgi:hypothetical protein